MRKSSHRPHRSAASPAPSTSDLTDVRTPICPAHPAPEDGSLADQSLLLRAAMVRAIKRCPKKRWAIAAEISALTARELTAAMLDKVVAESATGHRMPADQLAAFCLVTGDCGPLEIIAQPCGRLMLPHLSTGPLVGNACGQLLEDLAAIMQEAGEAAAEVRRTLADRRVTAAARDRCLREFLDIAWRALDAGAHLHCERRAS